MASKRKGSAPVESAVRAPAAGQEPAVSNSTSLDVDALRQIVEMLEASEVTLLSWRRGRERLVIRRGPPPMPPMPLMPAGPGVTAMPMAPPPMAVPHAPVAHHAPAAAPAAPAAREAAAAAPAAEKAGHVVTSPFVGTFYRTPAPDQPAFVDVGTVVKKGQVLCIIEAMKLMNEIESDVSGRVVEIIAQNGQPVEFGQALFRIESI